ncbi:BREX-1 system adenine-specific DNA-methyltransferase PglX [Methylicorpusculum oleiharenae]|uniref:BREX-1 system adenine-specific DNA-methyltransferase PglX n=1 Tax=Methylicorpusculum oleiharenae TaxID=1338687 RepID=UPI00135C683A|nr:BREX-1 system adenine-specific DNA-methyltransferase PglX [Methylicorpusculum oleiharenae]MCD2452774.1 BREX-1 system adenine-specific DNA-methyltransferase PglX [Methylicorpusculum oleiharenae]
METTKLKRFAQYARRSLKDQVETKLNQVLVEESAARRESAAAIRKLEEAIHNQGKDQVIERVAYIWFNRFCALRFMDVNRYNRVGIVSPADPGQFQPEILAEAKMGHIDDEMVPIKIRQQVFALLDGKAPSRDPQGEAYRLLVVAACNYWNKAMPFLFQRIEDYTELLMPDDLLSSNSILAHMREAISYQLSVISNEHEPADNCTLNTEGLEVEVIGWLYQFYISEKKDEVFDGLKKNKKITPENIPAATQLFTPHWIVRYLVENSLGRLWLLNRPGSKLAKQMDYYIKPEQAETDFLRISKPEEIKVCDPACGSGHMLTYAFDLLYAIYEEEGYEPAEIPEKILTHNLFGIEIDERAGELAAFALTMKARAKQRRFFNKGIKPNICVLENVRFDETELSEYMTFVGRELFTAPLQMALSQFEEADNFGSLIRPDVTDVDKILKTLASKNVSGHLFLSLTHHKVLQALRQADYLSPKYHVVVANPPYAGVKGLNNRLAVWLSEQFPSACSDLMTAFMERCRLLVIQHGTWSMINLPSWMFLGSYRKLRTHLLNSQKIISLIHLGRGTFGADFGAVAFSVSNSQPFSETRMIARKLFEKFSIVRTNEELEKLFLDKNYGRFNIKQGSLMAIPDEPIAYWLSENAIRSFSDGTPLLEIAPAKQGIKTGNNDRFLRFWQEVDVSRAALDEQKIEALTGQKKWFPCTKGGSFRRWYGNFEYLLNWENDGYEIRNYKDENGKLRSRPQNTQYFFFGGITWSSLTIGSFSARRLPKNFAFESKGSASPIQDNDTALSILGFMNSVVVDRLISALSPTVDYSEGAIGKLPIIEVNKSVLSEVEKLITLSRSDWDSYETSWDFTNLPLLNPNHFQPTLKATYQKLRAHWREMTLEMQRLEKENNRIFIDAYGLQNELTSVVPLNVITLTCNPHYRYSNGKSEEELEALLLADTLRELVSYAVGCMFGRYALDKSGLILANQGETLSNYLKQIPEPSFPADDDNVIPMLDGDWFTDDITERFRQFLRVAFGEEHYEENLKFVEQALNVKGKREYSIRDYFLGEFYIDHVKRYKKRPIYWLFSSPKGSFNALIYMHRYRPDTVSVVLNDYLREFRTKLTAHKSHLEAVSISASAAPVEKTKALKEIEKINKIIAELEEYEREILYPLATQQKEINLDDGVKVNYVKFGSALKKIVGLDAPED